jgi:hypothetical protein
MSHAKQRAYLGNAPLRITQPPAQNHGKIGRQACSGANMQPTSGISGMHSRSALLCLASVCLGGCSASGAPSFDLFGAFFPASYFMGLKCRSRGEVP